MSPVIIIAVLCGLMLFLLATGSVGRPFKLVGQICMKLMIGALFLFFLNAAGSKFGLHVPINLVTSSVSGFLGIPGMLGLAAIQLWILPH
ncbi:pro-sigmaK processing inhibitor BofA family protein [Falsibacillus albus]|uniref:Pro-sigmaK processing inhibitor BofA n=1 Tax=Falsibacillus albus TaxID=2478915 RepID=A0A3L7JI71_9BACI|nr:pro-sigmaK processing inhibitor BofA family protein [Falsibacillus albus]RLQ90025.1 pro-sigmaK processing inhibitor BofA [Falsibacillus albus]